ncbi:MAG: transglycosylase SLT domain-containing protein [Nitrospirae bacterium]|nr:transglycosylase SLT domain-containing protein [Nitrospirota bacterium]
MRTTLGNPKSDSSGASSEPPIAPDQTRSVNETKPDATQSSTPAAGSAETEPADNVFPSPSGDEALSSLNEPAQPETAAVESQDGLYTDSPSDPVAEAATEPATDQDDEITYDVPIVRNESVEDYIEYFQTEIRDKFKLWLERSGRYIPLMRGIFKEHGLPEDLVFVALIESGFNPYAYSRSRAVGAWQFIKGTGRLYGLRIDNWIDERRDPIKSTEAAARYLKDLYDRFGSWPLAMAGYNAGEGKIGRALIKAKADDFWDLRSTRYIRRETKGYVPKFMAATIIAKNPERYGFTLDYHEPLRYDTVSVPGSADLRVMAQAAGIAYEDLKILNPELRTELTPPYMEHYTLRLPVGMQQIFTDAYSQIPDERKIIGTRYTIRRNDTLAAVARRFGTSVSVLREINHLPQGHLLREGDSVFIPKLQAVPQEPKPRLVVSSPRPSRKMALAFKKPPIQMAALEKQDLSNSSDDGSKILYRVKDGDTLWDISKSFNVSIHDLKKYNGMGKRSMIRPGDQLVLGFQSKDL